MRKDRLVKVIVVLAVIFGLLYAAFLTVKPSAKASKDCFLGYKAHCSFTPISTVICVLAIAPFVFYLKRTLGDSHG
jgi:hypothetical protein